jgi:hypothetical protein
MGITRGITTPPSAQLLKLREADPAGSLKIEKRILTANHEREPE